jgi:predicted nucleic acid-binding protein
MGGATQRRPVTAEGLDGDVLIAAQGLAEAASIVTTNGRHFEGVVHASSWTAVPLADSL